MSTFGHLSKGGDAAHCLSSARNGRQNVPNGRCLLIIMMTVFPPLLCSLLFRPVEIAVIVFFGEGEDEDDFLGATFVLLLHRLFFIYSIETFINFPFLCRAIIVKSRSRGDKNHLFITIVQFSTVEVEGREVSYIFKSLEVNFSLFHSDCSCLTVTARVSHILSLQLSLGRLSFTHLAGSSLSVRCLRGK